MEHMWYSEFFMLQLPSNVGLNAMERDSIVRGYTHTDENTRCNICDVAQHICEPSGYLRAHKQDRAQWNMIEMVVVGTMGVLLLLLQRVRPRHLANQSTCWCPMNENCGRVVAIPATVGRWQCEPSLKSCTFHTQTFGRFCVTKCACKLHLSRRLSSRKI